jgi:hypothetical protein
MKETELETEISEPANQKAMPMKMSQSEFLARRGFWFFFPEKKNRNPHGR